MNYKAIGSYKVYENGTVVSAKGKVLKPRRHSHGYYKVCLRIDHQSQEWLVHRLVATLFIENPDNKPQVDHIDGNKENNAVSNLRWVDAYENYHNENTISHHIVYKNPTRTYGPYKRIIKGKEYAYYITKLSRRTDLC